ncbi:Uncharacterised protein [Mycobacteroides abscessus subsp. abscessus]|nr:Uncharacterised protein [Mycobacteroides abscessus subsp. abscessus]
MDDARAAQILELVVLAHCRKSETVVQFTDLVQRPRRVLRDKEHSVAVGENDDAASAGNSLARQFRTIAHDLFG